MYPGRGVGSSAIQPQKIGTLELDWERLERFLLEASPDSTAWLLDDGRLHIHDRRDDVDQPAPPTQRAVAIPRVDGLLEWQWQLEFSKAQPDRELRRKLERLLVGAGASRRFRRYLAAHPKLRAAFSELRRERVRQAAEDLVGELLRGRELTRPPWR